jgi:hypothetical protein
VTIVLHRCEESPLRLRWDLWSVQLLLRVALASGRGDARPEVHLFLADRYERLAAHHQRAGHQRAAKRLRIKAAAHRTLAGGDGPPYAAAMAMPHPRRSMVVDAIGGSSPDDPDNAA